MSSGRVGGAVDTLRLRVAQAVWLVCVLAALVLAAGALCIAWQADQDNGLVGNVLDTAAKVDLGVFSRQGGVVHFSGHGLPAATRNALVNWGLAAAVWLVGGRILDRIIRP